MRKCFSVSVVMRIAFGITLATFSLPSRVQVEAKLKVESLMSKNSLQTVIELGD